jgi:carbamoyl-phosphate synthase large subunit
MPRRTDIKTILVLGSGPIVIGQAAEFDYSGTQAVKALRAEGYRVVLVNSNPATIMTDPEFADRTYIEPLTPATVELIIARERPDALLPTLGGQTALNLAVALSENGCLEKYGVKLIGAQLPAIKKAEDRLLFKEAMERIGLALPKSGYARTLEEAKAIAEKIGFPIILRPSFTMGGLGGATCATMEEFLPAAANGIALSPTHTLLVEESIAGWKEYELEVIRDRKDNVIIVCSIENMDPMGVHTGDSITVAPVQTLTDVEYQAMRDAARKIMREIGVETGGSNVQFAIDPKTGRMVIIEMNPRVSRSSALASKATGYPIAKVAAKLAVGYTLDEIKNDITRDTPAAFEPTIDYVVVKIPRFNFEKFQKADQTLNTSMKSVGEAMAMGRTFKEAFQKAIRSLEVGSYGLESPFGKDPGKPGFGEYTADELKLLETKLRIPGPQRLWFVAEAFRAGYTIDRLHEACKFDPWFLREIEQIVKAENEFQAYSAAGTAADGAGLTVPTGNRQMEKIRALKKMGFSDRRLASLAGMKENTLRELCERMGVRRVFKRVDTCAAEFEAFTPYMYSTFEEENEVPPSDRKKIMILGGGPNRIGQGIEFDYCCVHAAFALKAAGFETIMVNCNPETVSTDYDTSDRLYFEPLTLEDVLAIWNQEKPVGAILQFGGQTPLKLAAGLAAAGVKILGTSSDAIDIAEDRERFTKFINDCGLRQPEGGSARSREEAHAVATRIGFPVMVRPSYVLGGRAMEVIHDHEQLDQYISEAVKVSDDKPVLLDRFLRNATEVDVDCLSDGKDTLIGGVMEHIEEAGVHSGDSACVLPPHTLSPVIIEEIERQAAVMAMKLGVVGLMNVQFAIEDNNIFILEVNPRASRTVPFVSKATGLPLAKIASLAMAGLSFEEQRVRRAPRPRHYSVKEAVFPFGRFTGADTLLGPEMRSTGEVMGISDDHAIAFGKAQEAAGNLLPSGGKVFISVRDDDKPAALDLAKRLQALGFQVVATRGTAELFRAAGVQAEPVNKVAEGSPHIVDQIKAKGISFVINTTQGKRAILDSHSIRRETLLQGIAYTTTMEGARAAVAAIEAKRRRPSEVKSVQEYHAGQ